VELQSLLRRVPRPRKLATHEFVAEVLREAITTGHLRANQPLPQDEIAAQLEVSHIPVREALRQLQSEGLVTYQPNRGAQVSALGPLELREIYEIRAILETAAIRRAVPLLTASEMDRGAAILSAAEATRDGAEWGSLDVEFHELIYRLDDRPQLRELIDGLLCRVDRYWLMHGLMLTHREVFEREHRALLQALRNRDAQLAADLLGKHLAGAADRLVAALAVEPAVTP
jgi:DNA-binding GntR family transcriptional regulator